MRLILAVSHGIYHFVSKFTPLGTSAKPRQPDLVSYLSS